jgi:hypothetical protein
LLWEISPGELIRILASWPDCWAEMAVVFYPCWMGFLWRREMGAGWRCLLVACFFVCSFYETHSLLSR